MDHQPRSLRTSNSNLIVLSCRVYMNITESRICPLGLTMGMTDIRLSRPISLYQDSSHERRRGPTRRRQVPSVQRDARSPGTRSSPSDFHGSLPSTSIHGRYRYKNSSRFTCSHGRDCSVFRSDTLNSTLLLRFVVSEVACNVIVF